MAARKTAKKNTIKSNATQKSITCSKKILIVSYIIGIVLTIVTIIGAFRGYDISTIGIITSAAYAEIAASNAFYYNKAKKENVLRIALDAVDKYPDDKVDNITKIISSLGGVL